MTDFGYYTEEKGPHRNVLELEKLVSENKTYVVEVFETENFGFHIRLKSENRRVTAEKKER